MFAALHFEHKARKLTRSYGKGFLGTLVPHAFVLVTYGAQHPKEREEKLYALRHVLRDTRGLPP